jgi:hypothetical protein
MTPSTATIERPTASRLQPVAFDLYRDIHKGIRAALFAVTTEAGRVDPSDDLGVIAVADEVGDLVRLLTEHAEHEDNHIDLLAFLPDIAAQVERDHATLEARMDQLVELAATACATPAATRRFAVHELYLELASFTGAYLAHQDMEERVIMPALERELGVPALIGIHEEIIGSMQPESLTLGLVAIFPAINVDDRTEMVGGMRASAPAEAFAGIWSLATSLLAPKDVAAVAARLGL